MAPGAGDFDVVTGDIAGYQDLVSYVDMLDKVQARIAKLVAAGATLEQVVAAKPTAD